jgi:hypothetical protein
VSKTYGREAIDLARIQSSRIDYGYLWKDRTQQSKLQKKNCDKRGRERKRRKHITG